MDKSISLAVLSIWFHYRIWISRAIHFETTRPRSDYRQPVELRRSHHRRRSSMPLSHSATFIDRDTANTIDTSTCSIVFSRLHYCNAILYGVIYHNLNLLQLVTNFLARIVCLASCRSSVTHLRRLLHRLPIRKRTDYKIGSLTFKVRLLHQPSYLSELVVKHIPTRLLRSSDKVHFVVPRTKTLITSRAFSLAAQKNWNSLPFDTRSTTAIGTFPQQFKTYLFDCAYH